MAAETKSEEKKTDAPEVNKKKGGPVVVKGTEHLVCKLTKEEVSEAGKALAEAIQRKVGIEQRLESFRSQAKADIAESEAVITKQTQLVASEKEFRLVNIEVTFDYKAGKKWAVRTDTGEIIWTRLISNEERQQTLV